MNPGYVALPFLAAVVMVLATTPVLMRIARKRSLYDPADARKTHTVVVSRLGGVGMNLAILFGGVVAMFWGNYPFAGRFSRALMVGYGPIFVVSLWDDIKPLPWWVRFPVQFAGAVLFVVMVGPMTRMNLPFGGTFTLGWWGYPLTIGWLLLTMNAMNFIDGIDGLAAGIGAIAGSVLLISVLPSGNVPAVALCAAAVGVCVGFLPYNFPPARIFMGDSGAALLGFVLGAVALVGAGKNVAFVSMLVPILALGVPLADSVRVLLHRSYRGVSMFTPDREHIHHVLLSLGLDEKRTLLLLYLVTALLGGIALLIATGPRIAGVFIAVLGAACFLLLLGRRGPADRG